MAGKANTATTPTTQQSHTHGFYLNKLPPLFILPTHLQPEEVCAIEERVCKFGGRLTLDATEARLFLGRLAQKKRAAFDLRARDVWTEEAILPTWRAAGGSGGGSSDAQRSSSSSEPVRKRRKVSASTAVEEGALSLTASESEADSGPAEDGDENVTDVTKNYWPDLTEFIVVLKLAWLDACIKKDTLVPFQPYTIYAAKIVPKPSSSQTSPKALASEGITYIKATPEQPSPSASALSSPSRLRTTTTTAAPTTILERARLEAESSGQAQASTSSTTAYPGRRRFGDHRSQPYQKSSSPVSPRSQRPKLHRTTTSELEELADHPLPPLPDWATGPYASYACCRSTPMNTPNAAFIAQLIKIRDSRILTLDEIGVRAYSTSIASVSAYPHIITHYSELTRLPGCQEKIARLWDEWQHSASSDSERHIATVQQLDADEDLAVLRLFWNIWGVGADTARKFYFEHGWKDLDDVVEFGWAALTRVQQIGVKFYEEFLVPIPRAEVEEINEVILRHARRVLGVTNGEHGTPRDVEAVIVGGYRRGKEQCGDVDVILSHRDEAKTKDLVVEVVRSLEAEGWVTHTLSLHTTTSDRGQATLPFRAQGHKGHGFDSLDKALCVWQDPNLGPETTSEGASSSAVAGGAGQKNPNIHRRVDIIVSTWRTVGCAVLGWSGGTTFQRDIRRFVNKVHGWKFDSSGVRDRGSGRVLDLEAPRARKHEKGDDEGVMMDDADTWMDRERRLMEGLGIGFRPPSQRCTG
ncbi:uncharacterized protein A1O9_04477 [Exophiala aquamarina CBS 119918]|uniref:BRCT domain-containing protein n=1 Tax=Exophiala aquamarina CBS 119918 TaxID=1182545 RepID=A0A072PIC3_9EURO|nr:uncharacterized protein A1O9_04477 [Exophiala aquamarina CBS 119918]KEF59631.1 hypothetical protein A1O9_04477 [Exophiala aquamarina CBS 119918]